MFKINIYLKFALIALFFGGGILLWVLYGILYSLPVLIIGIGLLASYFLLGTVTSASEMIQDGNFDAAKERLALTKFPGLLYVTNRAIYYIMQGSIAVNDKDTKTAEGLFDKALALKLPSDNERAMVLLQLANINAMKNKWTAAQNNFREAKKLNITEGMIKTQMDQFEKALSNRGQARAAASMGKSGHKMMQGVGGKRRRPKMR